MFAFFVSQVLEEEVEIDVVNPDRMRAVVFTL